MSAAEVAGCTAWDECCLPAGHEPPCFDMQGDSPASGTVVEIVDRPPSQAVATQSASDAAIDAAARAALAEPGIPGRDEVLSLALQARMFSGSDLAPESVRGKPYNAWLILMTGRALGLDPTAALRKVYVVDGQPTLAPQLTAALVRRQGLGRIQPHPDNSDEWAAAIPLGPDGRELGPMTVFTWDDAQTAGLVDPTCRPDAHNLRERTIFFKGGGSKKVIDCMCKNNWKSYPRRMLWWRAVGYCADDYFPEVSMGLYSPDELGAVTDEDGQPIDPTTIDVPAGYEDTKQVGGGNSGADPAADPSADPAALWALRERIAALPQEHRATLSQRWSENPRLKGHRVGDLPENLLRMATAIVTGFEGEAKKQGWSAEEALAGVRRAIVEQLPVAWGWFFPPPAPDAGATDATPPPDDDPAPDTQPPADDAPSATETPEHASDHDLAAMLAGLDDVDPALVDEVIGLVRQMNGTTVDAALKKAGLSTAGPVDERRQRLAAQMLRDRTRPAADDA